MAVFHPLVALLVVIVVLGCIAYFLEACPIPAEWIKPLRALFLIIIVLVALNVVLQLIFGHGFLAGWGR